MYFVAAAPSSLARASRASMVGLCLSPKYAGMKWTSGPLVATTFPLTVTLTPVGMLGGSTSSAVIVYAPVPLKVNGFPGGVGTPLDASTSKSIVFGLGRQQPETGSGGAP